MKVIHILLIIIFILFTILGVKVYNSNKKSEYSLVDIKNILDKSNNVENYECIIDKDYGLTIDTYKRKGNRVLTKNDKLISIYDYDLKICRHYYTSEKNEKIYSESNILSDQVRSSNIYTGIDVEQLISIGDLRVDSAKKVKLDGNNCLKVNLETTEPRTSMLIWINIENGLIMKTYVTDKKESLVYTYNFNTVTDEDLNPDLSDYINLEEYINKNK